MMTRRMAILNCLSAIGSILVGGPGFRRAKPHDAAA
jgi:hypothetical protein